MSDTIRTTSSRSNGTASVGGNGARGTYIAATTINTSTRSTNDVPSQQPYHHHNNNNNNENNNNNFHTISEQFEQMLGLKLSNDWYQDCYAALQQQQQRGRLGSVVTADMIFEQMLYHDLRDVVRNKTYPPYTSHRQQQQQQQSSLSTNAQLLRNICTTTTTTTTTESSYHHQQSQQGHPNYNTVVLPSSFRCCVQIEEVCNVAKDSESRLTTTTTTVTYGSSCYKLCLIDGYDPEQPFVAIEVSSLMPGSSSSITQQLLPGTKLLLYGGNIVIRSGGNSSNMMMMIGIHAGNCIVLGGQVERLIQIQNHAIQTSKQLSGHGIDPTIRALIWNNNNNNHNNTTTDDDLIDNHDDEDEHESRDVAIVSPPTVPPPQQQQQQRFLPPILPTPQSQTQQAIQRIPYPRIVAPSIPPPQQQNIDDDSRNRGRPVQHGSTTRETDTAGPYPIQVTASYIPSATSSTAASSSSLLQRLPQNRYLTASRSQSLPTTAAATSNNNVVDGPLVRPNLNSTTILSSVNIPKEPTTIKMTYTQFYNHMHRLVHNEQEYIQSMDQIYIVGPIQQIGYKLYFNIEKTSKRNNNNNNNNNNITLPTNSETTTSTPPLSAGSIENKQLQYVMIAKFGNEVECNTNTSLGRSITCRIASEVLEPHFPLSATELRKLSKSDKPKSDVIVRDCGKIAQQSLFQLETYEVTLERNIDELFRSVPVSSKSQPSLNGDIPFLCLKSLKFDQ